MRCNVSGQSNFNEKRHRQTMSDQRRLWSDQKLSSHRQKLKRDNSKRQEAIGVSMAEPLRRHTLSLKRKMELIEAVESQPSKKKVTIADEFHIHPSTLTTLIKEKEKYKQQYYSGAVRDPAQLKRYRLAKHDRIDKQLFTWFTHARAEGFSVNGPILKTKAEELSETFGIQNWKCSDGWLYRWKKRHGIAFRLSCNDQSSTGERPEQSADGSVLQAPPTPKGRWVEDVLLRTLEWYEPRNIFCLGVSALFWRLLPTNMHRFKGDKCFKGQKSKERLTMMLCCNMDGSEKMPLCVVGKFKNPQCFQGVKALPVQYRSNPRAWISADIFLEWLQSLDTKMAKQGRKVLLVLDSCLSQTTPALEAVEILWLPEISSFRLHPCDLGISESFKVHYKKMKVLKLIAFTSAGGVAGDYQFTLTDAVCGLRSAWDKVSPGLIRNCFRKARFKVGEKNVGTDDLPDEPELAEDEGQESLLWRVFEDWNVSPREYYSCDNDIAVTTSATSVPYSASPVQSTSLASCRSPQHEDLHSDNDDDCGKQEDKVSGKTVLNCVKTLQTFCLQAGCGNSLMNSFNTFVQHLDKHLACASYQTRITQFFRKEQQTANKEKDTVSRILDSSIVVSSKGKNAEGTRMLDNDEGQNIRETDVVPQWSGLVNGHCVDSEGSESAEESTVIVKVENAEDDDQYGSWK